LLPSGQVMRALGKEETWLAIGGRGWPPWIDQADHSHDVHDDFYAPGAWGLDGIKPLGILEPLPCRELGPAKVRLFTHVVMERHLRNVLDICTFIGRPLDKLVELVKAATGWDASSFELMKMGERVINLARVVNLTQGLTARGL